MDEDHVPKGFSLIEVLIVVVIGGVLLSLATVTCASYNQRTAARAGLFARPEPCSQHRRTGSGKSGDPIRRDQQRLSGHDRGGKGSRLQEFRVGGEYRLSAVDLGMPGDSLSFSSRGFADLSGLGTPLGSATFTGGNVAYKVEFNGMGASKVGAL